MTTTLHDTVALQAHRESLLRYARRRLRDAALAEDVVHDALLAVLTGEARFAARSSLRTWLIGVLKHKIVDAVRRQRPHESVEAMDESDTGAATPAALCDVVDPLALAEQRQALARVDAGLAALPASLRRTFELYAVLGHSAEEVCGMQGITQSNLWVRVHRVRKELLAA
jgi:RNA polymerase sigma-70 factor, ECF subfamily